MVDERFDRPWQPLKGIYIFKNHICSRIFLPHHYIQKYITLLGAPNKKFCACHFIDTACTKFCVRKSIISRRIWGRIQQGFSPWIRGYCLMKKPKVEICPFKQCNFNKKCINVTLGSKKILICTRIRIQTLF
jgi:hypothetical protein